MTTKVTTQRDYSPGTIFPKYFAPAIAQSFTSALIDETTWVGKEALLQNTLAFLSFQIAQQKSIFNELYAFLFALGWLPLSFPPRISNRWKGEPGASLRLHPKPIVDHVPNPNRVAAFEHKVRYRFRSSFAQLAKITVWPLPPRYSTYCSNSVLEDES